jgi:hypothetical protein
MDISNSQLSSMFRTTENLANLKTIKLPHDGYLAHVA